MPEDVLAPPPAPTADDLKFGNPKFKPPEANDPEFIKRRAEAIERDKIKNVPPRPDHPFADPEKRLYRQPDGTLGRKRPPRKPYTVAARTRVCRFVPLREDKRGMRQVHRGGVPPTRNRRPLGAPQVSRGGGGLPVTDSET